MGVPPSASRVSAPDHLEPVPVPHELLAGRPDPRARYFRLLDLAPVVVIGRHPAPAAEQLLQALGAWTSPRAPGGHRSCILVGAFVPVGPVGPDSATGSPPSPTDG